MLSTWRTAADADHQTDSDVGKAVQHVSCDACCRGCAILPVGQDSDDDVVFPNFAQCVIVVVIGRHIFRSFVLFVEKSLRGNVLRTYGADPADGVVLTIRHTHWRSAIEAGQNVRSSGGRGGSGRKACRNESKRGELR